MTVGDILFALSARDRFIAIMQLAAHALPSRDQEIIGDFHPFAFDLLKKLPLELFKPKVDCPPVDFDKPKEVIAYCKSQRSNARVALDNLHEFSPTCARAVAQIQVAWHQKEARLGARFSSIFSSAAPLQAYAKTRVEYKRRAHASDRFFAAWGALEETLQNATRTHRILKINCDHNPPSTLSPKRMLSEEDKLAGLMVLHIVDSMACLVGRGCRSSAFDDYIKEEKVSAAFWHLFHAARGCVREYLGQETYQLTNARIMTAKPPSFTQWPKLTRWPTPAPPPPNSERSDVRGKSVFPEASNSSNIQEELTAA